MDYNGKQYNVFQRKGRKGEMVVVRRKSPAGVDYEVGNVFEVCEESTNGGSVRIIDNVGAGNWLLPYEYMVMEVVG